MSSRCPVAEPASGAAPAGVTVGAADRAWLFLGSPNVGKSTLINRLSGSRLAVGNWSGTTLDADHAFARVHGTDVTLVDLPGVYTLDGSEGADALPDELLRRHPGATVVNVVDAARLERDLTLTLELIDRGHPMVVCLTMVDEARRRGRPVDPEALAGALGVPVCLTDAGRTDRDAVLAAVGDARAPRRDAAAAVAGGDGRAWAARTEAARALAARATTGSGGRSDPSLGIDRLALHPLLGPLLLVALLALAFHLTFALANPWVDALGALQAVLAGWITATGLPPLLRSFLADGVVAGVGTVVAFVPILFAVYLLLGVLENAGVLARIAFLADRLMRALGLPGHAVLPIVLAAGCNVPAVQATRALPRRSDRLRVALALPSMTCSARLPVVAVIAAAVAPAYAAWVVTGAYLLGFAVAVGTALLLGRVLRAPAEGTVLELPPYRVPPVGLVTRLAWLRTRAFLRGAGGPILAAVVVVWALQAVTIGGVRPLEALARAVAPVFRPLGWGDWRFVGALLPGAVAKEVVLGSLGVTLLGAEPTTPLTLLQGARQLAAALGDALRATAVGVVGLGGAAPRTSGPLATAVAGALSLPAAMSYLAFTLLYVPCVATLTALRRQFGTRWALFSAGYQLALAYVVAWLAAALLGRV